MRLFLYSPDEEEANEGGVSMMTPAARPVDGWNEMRHYEIIKGVPLRGERKFCRHRTFRVYFQPFLYASAKIPDERSTGYVAFRDDSTSTSGESMRWTTAPLGQLTLTVPTDTRTSRWITVWTEKWRKCSPGQITHPGRQRNRQTQPDAAGPPDHLHRLGLRLRESGTTRHAPKVPHVQHS